MKEQDQNRMKKLLQQAMPPMELDAEPARDLWPDMLLRLDAKAAAPTRASWVWFDWALAGGLVGLVAFFPASIPLLLYYL